MPSIFALKCNHANSLFLSCTVCIPLSAFSFHVQCPFSYQLFPFMHSTHSPISFFLSCTVSILLSAFSLAHNTHHSNNLSLRTQCPFSQRTFIPSGNGEQFLKIQKRCMFLHTPIYPTILSRFFLKSYSYERISSPLRRSTHPLKGFAL